ncbi:M15 family metallopeptidase [Oscillatoria sp. CS-180]|uniref:M15 family metallopeptidase n=1 Tax=Oscillatoria sp. CS-180 TaxID=3021720 RepID=UPI00232FB5E7|nr:M15 family metallopeptidase [Oscillatoria sp. CS-180]MDB9528229.1 M15 family metallopeptidase [Oscillatoria sp. CS-180]
MKPYQQIPIQECGDPLVPISPETFAIVTPHPYEALGAPYGDRSPYWLRKTVTNKLQQAQNHLQSECPGWRIQIFDAYRPISVQQFMVDYTAQSLAQQRGVTIEALSDSEQESLLETVYQFWALPSQNPATPPPHSTGAAVDITLVNEAGQAVEMGSPIDEVSPRSQPDYFQPLTDAVSKTAHANRHQLRRCMETVGFQQHPNEWWHFSYGDQLWAWLISQKTGRQPTACYGQA